MNTAHENYSRSSNEIENIKERFDKALKNIPVSVSHSLVCINGSHIEKMVLDITAREVKKMNLPQLLTEAFDDHLEMLNELRKKEARETLKDDDSNLKHPMS